MVAILVFLVGLCGMIYFKMKSINKAMKMVKKKCEGAVKKGNALGEFYFFHIIYQFSLYVLNFIAQFGGRVAARFGEIAGRGGQGRAPRGRLPAVPPFNVNRNQAAAGEIIEGE